MNLLLPQQMMGPCTGRVWNILLLGSDNDGKYTFPAVLTQVMMVVHIDTIHNQVYMVSIPRNSWVSRAGSWGHAQNRSGIFSGGRAGTIALMTAYDWQDSP